MIPKTKLSNLELLHHCDLDLLNLDWSSGRWQVLPPASKLVTGEGGKDVRLLAQELRPVLTFLAARVKELHLILSFFFCFEWSAEVERVWAKAAAASDRRNELLEVGLLLQ